MSFSAGVFSINTAGQPVVTGTTIAAVAFNALTADLASGLSTCILKDGSQTTTAVIPFAAGITVGLGTTVTEITATTYTPTLTSVTNVAASTARQCQYIRIGNVVTVSGNLDLDPTAAAATELGISLPVASNIGNTWNCGGVASNLSGTQVSAAILGDASNNRASLQFAATDTGNITWSFVFQYLII